jgi:hypothetical protein
MESDGDLIKAIFAQALEKKLPAERESSFLKGNRPGRRMNV